MLRAAKYRVQTGLVVLPLVIKENWHIKQKLLLDKNNKLEHYA